jgi:hypothetical protein
MTDKLILSIPFSALLVATPLPALAQEDVVGPTGPPVCDITEDVRAAHDAWRDQGRDVPLAEVVGGVDLRSGPGTTCDTTYFLPAGGTVDLVGCGAVWCGIVYGTEAGYVPKRFLGGQVDRAAPIPEW